MDGLSHKGAGRFRPVRLEVPGRPVVRGAAPRAGAVAGLPGVRFLSRQGLARMGVIMPAVDDYYALIFHFDFFSFNDLITS
jgi:hypothetical protein